jgi:hypothetical protein
MPQFIEDLQAAVEELGTDYPGLLLGIANADWENADQRDGFLKTLKTL